MIDFAGYSYLDNRATIVCRHVFLDGTPVLVFVHDADGDIQFMCGESGHGVDDGCGLQGPRFVSSPRPHALTSTPLGTALLRASLLELDTCHQFNGKYDAKRDDLSGHDWNAPQRRISSHADRAGLHLPVHQPVAVRAQALEIVELRLVTWKHVRDGDRPMVNLYARNGVRSFVVFHGITLAPLTE